MHRHSEEKNWETIALWQRGLFVVFCIGLFLWGDTTRSETSSRTRQRANKMVSEISNKFTSPDWIEKRKSKTSGRGAVRGPNPEYEGIRVGDDEPLPDLEAPPLGQPSGGGGQAQTSGNPQDRTYWIPICVLVDASAHDAGTVAQGLKTLADRYGADCDIAVSFKVVNVQPGSYGADVTQIIQQARGMCNVNQAFQIRGSVMAFLGNPELPQNMCNDDTAIACSNLCGPLAAAVLGPGSDPQTVVHESLHSNCCGRLCLDTGQGTQDAGFDIEVAHSHELPAHLKGQVYFAERRNANVSGIGNISPAACQSLQQGSSLNSGIVKWDEQNPPEFYYQEPQAGEVAVPLDGNPLFVPRPDPVAKTKPPGAAPPPGEDGGKVGKRDAFNDNPQSNQVAQGNADAKKAIQQAVADQQAQAGGGDGNLYPSLGSDERHQGSASNSLASLGGGGAAGPQDSAIDSSAINGGRASGTSIEFNDNEDKRKVGSISSVARRGRSGSSAAAAAAGQVSADGGYNSSFGDSYDSFGSGGLAYGGGYDGGTTFGSSGGGAFGGNVLGSSGTSLPSSFGDDMFKGSKKEREKGPNDGWKSRKRGSGLRAIGSTRRR